MSETVLDHLATALERAATHNSAVEVPPAVVLWPDGEGQWQPAARQLRERWPHLLTLGDYEPGQRTGPAIWLKCMLAGCLPEADWAAGSVPVLYLPGVSRLDLRAVENCPRHLQLLAELQYRGVLWSQANGKDWTLSAFLASRRGGLALDVARDQATQTALRRAAEPLLEVKVADLPRGRLTDSFFDSLLSSDPVRDLLRWMDRPQGMQAEWAGERWAAFLDRCRRDYHLDPERDGVLVAVERLAAGEGGQAWQVVWSRFAEANGGYPGVVQLLQTLEPKDLASEQARYPKVNAQEEAGLRQALTALASLSAADAGNRVAELDRRHGPRRSWVWYRRGDAPLAAALEHLVKLAESGAMPFHDSDAEAMAARYREHLWSVDWHALRALACVRTQADQQAVSAALTALYVPWLGELAVAFQEVVRNRGYPGLGTLVSERGGDYAATGQCLLFVDGLRYDVAQELVQRLEAAGQACNLGHTWAPFPSVTATGKPWVSPVAERVRGRPPGSDFQPGLADDERPLSGHHFRKLLESSGWQVLKGNDTGEPSGQAWVEYGDLDHFGHEHGLRLASEVPRMVEALVERLGELFDAGWRRVTLVTDHGWLLVPGGMPKVQLDKQLTETRWGRCAVTKPGAPAPGPVLGWGWCDDVLVTSAPGISTFIAGMEYGHGGLSLQECLVPVIDVSPGAAPAAAVEIEQVRWVGLRCRVQVAGAAEGYTADVRSKAADAGSSFCAAAKAVREGQVSLVVTDEEHEGAAALVVVLDEGGNVVAKQSTVIGG